MIFLSIPAVAFTVMALGCVLALAWVAYHGIGISAIVVKVLSLTLAWPALLGVALGSTVLALTIDTTGWALVIGAVAAGVVLIIKALSDKQLAAINALNNTAKVIEGHVNSAATRDMTVIDAKNKQIETLTAQLSEAKTIASARAATDAAVSVAAAGRSAPDPISGDAAPATSLAKIDKNTADTAKNTERVQAAVSAIKKKRS